MQFQSTLQIRSLLKRVEFLGNFGRVWAPLAPKRDMLSAPWASLTHLCPPLRFRNQVPTCAVRETASLGIMGAPRVPSLNPSETIVL